MSSRQPSLKKRYKPAQIEEAIIKADGLTARLCAILDCSYQQLYVWYQAHPGHEKMAEQLRSCVVDKAEAVVHDIMDGDAPPSLKADLAKFVLKTQGKSRGWTEQKQAQEITVKDGEVSIKQIFGIDDQHS